MPMKAATATRLYPAVVPCAVILLCASQVAFAAALITGQVRNRTSGQPASGDEVILLRLDPSPHEQTRTKIDASGQFTFNLPDPGSPHLVRVVHQGVNYDRHIADAGAISIDVFDAAAKVQGVTGNIEIVRAGTRGGALHVSDMIEIWNQSNPPVTQAGPRSFEVYLPADATISSVLAAGPENMAASISSALIPGEPGHYTVNFPLLPGATKFAFNYDLPYNGNAKFRAKTVYPIKQLAVMIPPTMTFASRSSAFQPLPVGADRYQVEAAENVKAGTGLEFEISGKGELPALQAQSHPSPNHPAAPAIASAPATAASPTPNAGGAAVPVPKIAARASTAWWWVLGASALALAVFMFLLWPRRRLHRPALALVAPSHRHALHPAVRLVDALKECLFQLESDRMQGIIRGEDYTSAKQALEETIRWAITRTQNREANTAAR
jgi:hypothetical protein